MIRDSVALVFGIANHAFGLHPAITVNAKCGAIKRDYLLRPVAQKVKHVINRLSEKERSAAVPAEFELVPEVLFCAVSVPITLDEVWISVERICGPSGNQIALVIEPNQLRTKTTGTTWAIGAGIHHNLGRLHAGKNIARSNLLGMIGHILPEQFTSSRFVSQSTNVTLPGEQFQFAIAVNIGKLDGVHMVVVVVENVVIFPHLVPLRVQTEVADNHLVDPITIEVDRVEVVA